MEDVVVVTETSNFVFLEKTFNFVACYMSNRQNRTTI